MDPQRGPALQHASFAHDDDVVIASQFFIERFAQRVMESQQGRDAGSLSLICVDTGARTGFMLERGVCREIPPASRSPKLVTALTMVTSEAALEGVMAFLERREPSWQLRVGKDWPKQWPE